MRSLSAVLFLALSAFAAPPQPITIDYPHEGSIFPPDFAAPTFLWRDPSPAIRWSIEVAFPNGGPLRASSLGEPMRIGEIDERCIAPTNELPKLTPEQAAAHTWKPSDADWAAIRKRALGRVATVTITGYSGDKPKDTVSRAQVRIEISHDPVGAPIFYRDVPLMPNEEKQVVTPLARSAMGLIAWRMRNVSEPASKILMTGLPSCGNCHSFSNDGKTIGMDLDGPGNDKGLYALAPVGNEISLRNENVIKWSSFRGKLGGKVRAAFMSQVSPDGRYVVTTILDPLTANPERDRDPIDDKFYGVNFKDYKFLQVFYPTRGVLAWYSRDTGHLQPLPGADDPRFVQTDGFWSPDGKYLVFARATAKAPYQEGQPRAQYANDPNETQIQYDLYRIPFNDGKGGTPERIVGASQNGMSNNFPKVSPDGKWIVFVQCRNGQLMRPDSKLYIVPFEGGEARLMKCNTPTMNSWHSFSPNGRWMVFSSKARSPYTQMYLTHIAEDGSDSPPILIENSTAANRAVNLPEFLNAPHDHVTNMKAPATDFFASFDRAMALMEKNDIDAAIPQWREAVALNPTDDRCHFNLAIALDQKGLRDEAASHYRKVIELEPDNTPAYLNLGATLAAQGNLDEAAVLFSKAIAAKPSDARAHANLAAVHLQAGQLDDAILHSQEAIALDPKYADAFNTLGWALARKSALPEAEKSLTKAVELTPDSFEYRYNLGRVLAAQRKFEPAIPQFEKAVLLSKGQEPYSVDMLAAMYSEVGRIDDAVLFAQRAIVLATQLRNETLRQELEAKLARYKSLVRQR
jgi:tetratricopeptide (TPR) repeat protein